MKFVVLQVYDNYIDANIIMGRLEEEGINCWLKDENTVTMTPFLTNAVGGIKLMAPETQAEKAFALLRQFRSEIQAVTKCSRCGSANVEFITTPRKPGNWFSALFGFLSFSFAMPVEKVYHCFDCGNEFEMPKEAEPSV